MMRMSAEVAADLVLAPRRQRRRRVAAVAASPALAAHRSAERLLIAAWQLLRRPVVPFVFHVERIWADLRAPQLGCDADEDLR